MFQLIDGKGKRLARAVIVLAAMLVMSGAGIYHHKTGPEHFAVVDDGILYRSALLTPNNLERVLDRYSIKTVVDLSAEHDPKRQALHEEEAGICRTKGVVWLSLSLPPETPPDDTQISRWLDLMRNPANHPVLVHCTHGVVRTGIMTAIYEMEFNHGDNRRVLAGLPTFGHDWEQNVRAYILNYCPRAAARANNGKDAVDPV